MGTEIQDRRGVRQQIIAGLVVVAVVIAVWLLWPRVPLRGQTEHDFGVVSFETPPHYLEHTFSLTNTSSEPYQIMRTSSSCGCTEAIVSGEVVGSGETLHLPVRLKLTHSGLKEAVVTVYFYDGQSLDLGIRATGDMKRTLRAVPSKVRLLPPRGRGQTKLWMESDVKPSTPEIESPERLEVTFVGWKQTGKKNEETATPASWTGEVILQASGEGPPQGSVLSFVMPNGERVEVTMNPRTYFPPPTTDDPLPVQPAGGS